MKRALAVVVLISVAVLAFLFWPEDEAPTIQFEADPAPRGGVMSGSRPARIEREAAPVAQVQPADAGDPLAEVPPWLEAPLRAVGPHVQLCVDDQRPRLKGPIDVQLHFTPLPDGGFAPHTRVRPSLQDPYVTACIEDVFDEVGYVPNGRERFEPADFAFHAR